MGSHMVELNNIDKDAFQAGFVAGAKRVNVKKVPEDVRDELKSYVAGYVVGFLLKFGIAVGVGVQGNAAL